MATSPLRSPSGEPPQSPQSFHSPLQSPTHEPAPSGNLSSIPPSPSLNNNNNNDHNNSNSSNNKVNSTPRSPTNETLSPPVVRSPSRGAVNNNHLHTPSSPLGNKNGTVNSPMIRSPVTRPNHLSVPQSPSNNNSKESPSNNRPIWSPKLGPMPVPRSFKQSVHIQPPSLNALTESEPSQSPISMAMIFNEEAIESPLRMDRDRSDGPGRVTGSGGRGNMVVAEAVWRAEMRHAAIFLRVLAAVLCLVSFSVMAADRTTGWDGDWYQRYAEYRFVLTVNVMTFVYSCFQLFTEIYRVVTTRHLISRPQSYYIDLFMDQVLAYLLMSASSVAASHNDIWVSRFGGDEFTRKINGSVAMSFLAFVALALSSVISTYIVFRWLA